MNCEEAIAAFKSEVENLRKNLQLKNQYNEGLRKQIIEVRKNIRSITGNVSSMGEIKKNPADLVHQNIVQVVKKYDEEISPKVGQLREMKTKRVNQFITKLNMTVETFNQMVAYTITFDKFMEKRKNENSNNEMVTKKSM
ncbi:uncharacterized protein LOC107369364 [Tetranychus urticae]|uniref:uncharacterized protein LOC107369364 n=1 Tax=Tetranychus urticae TaxID=32264 RepID=UPI00077BC85C|nr:uncharacterized protein LOC107369364 [Tetranychus urticae]